MPHTSEARLHVFSMCVYEDKIQDCVKIKEKPSFLKIYKKNTQIHISPV